MGILETEPQNASIRMLRSAAGGEWVSSPTVIRSTRVRAMSPTVARLTFRHHDLHPAGSYLTCASDVVECHVVEQDHVRAGRNCPFKLREVFAFDLDFQRTRRCLASQFDRDADRTSGGDMSLIRTPLQAKAMIEINTLSGTSSCSTSAFCGGRKGAWLDRLAWPSHS